MAVNRVNGCTWAIARLCAPRRLDAGALDSSPPPLIAVLLGLIVLVIIRGPHSVKDTYNCKDGTPISGLRYSTDLQNSLNLNFLYLFAALTFLLASLSVQRPRHSLFELTLLSVCSRCSKECCWAN